VSNNVGLVPGGVSGSFGYRRELAGRRALVLRVAATSALGALMGAALLLTLPSTSFDRAVPFLVLTAASLVGLQPLVSKGLRRRAEGRGSVVVLRERMGPGLTTLSSLVGIYGGYFGAAQGVLLLAFLALGLDLGLQTVNGLKNVGACRPTSPRRRCSCSSPRRTGRVVELVATESLVGGWLGARLGRRLPPTVFRTLIVVFGGVVGLRLLLA
jgi:uncharacterized membrane protein YfcA